VPWCEQCSRLVDKKDLIPSEGKGRYAPRDCCPVCGREIASAPVVPGAVESFAASTSEADVQPPGEPSVAPEANKSETEEEHTKAPWHFKLLVGGTAIYLAWRLYQGVGWLIHHA
jgi:hypothetical protein